MREKKVSERNVKYKKEPNRNLELKNKITKIKLNGWAQHQNGKSRGRNQ